MLTSERLAEQFEKHRPHMRAVAYRMLGSVSEAEDAVQEAWIRLSRTDVSGVDNLRAWLTTIVARVCLDMLRTRASRREDPSDVHVPDPIITRATSVGGEGPEANAMLADAERHARRRCRSGAARRPREAGAGGTTGVRAPRRVWDDLRGDRTQRGALGRGHAPAREPRAPAGSGPGADRRRRPGQAAPRRRRVSRGRPGRRLRRAGRRARSGYRAAG